MTTGVTTRLQRKSRNTSRVATSLSSSTAAASVSESQTTTTAAASTSSNSTATRTVSSTAPLPTVTVTVNSSVTSQENAKEEIDPLSGTASPSPAPSAPNVSNTRRSSHNGNQSIETSFLPAVVKTEPDGDIAIKKEPDAGNNWASYPLNGIKREIKTEENSGVTQDEKSAVIGAIKKEDGNMVVDTKQNDTKEDTQKNDVDDGKVQESSSAIEIKDDEWNETEPR